MPDDKTQFRPNASHVASARSAAPETESPSFRAAQAFPVEPERFGPTVEARTAGAAAVRAMDSAYGNYTAAASLTFASATAWPGFPALALLNQLPEYQAICSVVPDDCVRTFGQPASRGDGDADRLTAIADRLAQLGFRDVIRTVALHDHQYGGAHLYIRLAGDADRLELPVLLTPNGIAKGDLQGLQTVEPYWVTPNNYNSSSPLAPSFFQPTEWLALGQRVHRSRMMPVVGTPVSDMLKPAYNFRGLSLTQAAMRYVDNWLRTQQSVSDIIKQFSVSGVLTDMSSWLAPGGADLLRNRADLINAYRDNRNLLFLDRQTEEFFQFNTPLSTLDHLQAQAQEHLAAITHVPLVKLLGISPSGLNASSEGEIRIYYDWVGGYQQRVLSPVCEWILKVVQLDLFGAIDDSIYWQWLPLWTPTAAEAADIRLKDAQTDATYADSQILAPETIRERLRNDPDGLYHGLEEPDDIDYVNNSDEGNDNDGQTD